MSSDPSPEPQRRWRHRNGLLAPTHAIDAIRAIDASATLNLKRAIPSVLLTLICFGIGDRLGGVDQTHDSRVRIGGKVLRLTKGQVSLVVLGLCVVFVVAGVIATRSVANELNRVSTARATAAAGSALRLITSVVGYATVLLGLLSLLRVDLGNLLVGGAVTGVVVGIAAQQTLGNFFAGLVLLFARPFVPGQRVRVNTGAMGGPFEGVILGSGLVYTTIETEAGVVSMPNSGLLAAAIGPVGENAGEDPTASTASPEPEN